MMNKIGIIVLFLAILMVTGCSEIKGTDVTTGNTARIDFNLGSNSVFSVWALDGNSNVRSLGQIIDSEEEKELFLNKKAIGNSLNDVIINKVGDVIKSPKVHGASDEVAMMIGSIEGTSKEVNLEFEANTDLSDAWPDYVAVNTIHITTPINEGIKINGMALGIPEDITTKEIWFFTETSDNLPYLAVFYKDKDSPHRIKYAGSGQGVVTEILSFTFTNLPATMGITLPRKIVPS
ncbi:hypothetical protein J4468_04885 [Candidatus Woesearchaeota archaeon]|nr:hypothetical protein [Candidatus Woesearchaeota archaeon]